MLINTREYISRHSSGQRDVNVHKIMS